VFKVHGRAAGGCGRPPLYFFNYVECGVQYEGIESTFGGGEACDAVTATARSSEFVSEEGGVCGREDSKCIRHFGRCKLVEGWIGGRRFRLGLDAQVAQVDLEIRLMIRCVEFLGSLRKMRCCIERVVGAYVIDARW
jgi:hypothetical protein